MKRQRGVKSRGKREASETTKSTLVPPSDGPTWWDLAFDHARVDEACSNQNGLLRYSVEHSVQGRSLKHARRRLKVFKERSDHKHLPRHPDWDVGRDQLVHLGQRVVDKRQPTR
eukprot:682687-Rhodomonas_salina.2